MPLKQISNATVSEKHDNQLRTLPHTSISGVPVSTLSTAVPCIGQCSAFPFPLPSDPPVTAAAPAPGSRSVLPHSP